MSPSEKLFSKSITTIKQTKPGSGGAGSEPGLCISAMDSIHQFLDYIRKYRTINEDLESYLLETLKVNTYPKNHQMVTAGKKPSHIWFLLEGSAKATYPNEIDFEEKTSWFWNENELIYPLNGLLEPSNINIYVTQKSKLIPISLQQFHLIDQFFEDFLHFQNAFLKELTAKISQHLYYLQHLSSKERFLVTRKANPIIFTQYNLQDLADYLGMSERTLKQLRSLKL